MPTIELKPIKESTRDYEQIEARIKKIFRAWIYVPLLASLQLSANKILNAKDDLAGALRSGKITFSGDTFRGNFNAIITKELKSLGAKWDRKTSTFRLAEGDVPYELREIIRTSEIFFAERLAGADRLLEKIIPEEVAGQVNVTDLFDSVLWKVEKEFQKSIANITVSPKLEPHHVEKISSEWKENMDLWIKDFTEKHIKELRETVQKAAYSSNRYESLVKGIETKYSVSENKAKFLARQETNLLMAKFKESRYTSAGVNEYVWGCVKMPHDNSPQIHTPGNVRYYHGILEGGTFRWDDPPLTNKNPDRKSNPGQDYNCRCFPRPIVKF